MKGKYTVLFALLALAIVPALAEDPPDGSTWGTHVLHHPSGTGFNISYHPGSVWTTATVVNTAYLASYKFENGYASDFSFLVEPGSASDTLTVDGGSNMPYGHTRCCTWVYTREKMNWQRGECYAGDSVPCDNMERKCTTMDVDRCPDGMGFNNNTLQTGYLD